MGQVPQYGVIGDGRLARHFLHYFRLLNIDILQWSRRSDPDALQLSTFVAACDIILILISDDAIANFIQTHPVVKNKILIHCSGALVISDVVSVHPLMTFSNDLYDLSVYESIPFVMEQEYQYSFSTLFPRLKNPHYLILQKDKPYYHALCVMSGNFTVILWQHFLKQIQEHWQWPENIAMPYCQQILKNIMTNPYAALTGPIARGDTATILKNQQALLSAQDKFLNVYESMVKAYHLEKNNELS